MFNGLSIEDFIDNNEKIKRFREDYRGLKA
jgi:hypothetical protein